MYKWLPSYMTFQFTLYCSPSGPPPQLPANKLLTGTLADGTPFAFTSSEGDHLSSVKLLRSNDLATGPPTIIVSTAAAPLGVRAGQTLTLQSGGTLPDNFNAGMMVLTRMPYLALPSANC